MLEAVNCAQYIEFLGTRISLYSTFLAIAVSVLYLLSSSELVKKKYSEFELWILLLLISVFGLVFGRGYFVLLNASYYSKLAFVESLSVWKGGIHIFGVFIGAILALLIFSKIFKKKLLEITDSITLFLPLAQIIGRVGNYFNAEFFGKPTDLPWAVGIPSNCKYKFLLDMRTTYHPVFAYEMILNLVNFIILYLISKKFLTQGKIKKNKMGFITAAYFFNYSLIRFFLEFLRSDPNPEILGLRLTQWLCLLIITIAGGFILFFLRSNNIAFSKGR